MIRIIALFLISSIACAQDTATEIIDFEKIKEVYRANLKGHFKDIAKTKSDNVQVVVSETQMMLAEFDQMIAKIEGNPYIKKDDNKNVVLIIDERLRGKWKLPEEFYDKVHNLLKVDIPSKRANNP